MANIGQVGPIHGRWVWPFKRMEIGDEFYVRFEDRQPEDVRRLATVRAAQLGLRLSTRKDDANGVMWVRRIDWDTDEAALPKELSYEQVGALLRRQYGLEANDVPWHTLSTVGESFEMQRARINSDARSKVLAEVGSQRFSLVLKEDRIIATLDWTPHSDRPQMPVSEQSPLMAAFTKSKSEEDWIKEMLS